MFGKARTAACSMLSRRTLLIINDSTTCWQKSRVAANWKLTSRHYSEDAPQAKLEEAKGVLPVNKFVQRTHTCGELTLSNVGEDVQLCGWMEFQRMAKFVTLRDAYGSTQLIIPDKMKDIVDAVNKLSYESVLAVTGRVIPRPEGQENPAMKTGYIEIEVDSLKVLNQSMAQLPFGIRQHNTAKEGLQMQYRYLSLRFPEMQRNLRLRSRVTSKMREYLVEHCDFVDVETPTLFRPTPGVLAYTMKRKVPSQADVISDSDETFLLTGAQEFVVPTRYPGKFYSLVQSPQQFKQLLMIGGIDRYFQIARCYRDEGARHDRQPEFTQLDIEMSFTDREGIMSLVEELIAYCWPSEELGTIKLPIERMSFEEVYETYGSEQPDLRIPYRIHNVTEYFVNDPTVAGSQTYAMSFPTGQDYLTTSVKTKLNDIRAKNFIGANLTQIKIAGDAWKTKLSKLFVDEKAAALEQKLNLKDGDALFIARGNKDDARSLLGKARVEFANAMESKGQKVRSGDYKFLWVVDFPLFYQQNDGTIATTHHPFTQPHPDDFPHFESDPLKVRGLHYDLVLNGSEIAGGSIRIHDSDLQKRVLDMLRIDSSQMKHLLEALASGAPPHGGIAFGLDRLISLMCNASSIRSVIAFPKTMEGRDLMSGAPVSISDDEKRLYHLRTLDDDVQPHGK